MAQDSKPSKSQGWALDMTVWKASALKPRHGIVVKTWQLEPETCRLDLADLEKLFTPRTRLLAVHHVSNLLGTINPIRSIAELAHQHKVLVCVDGVAFAPHRRVDVKAFDVDFYVYSFYKVYGPHLAVLYGRQELLESLEGINFDFIQSGAYKFQPGNLNFELTYSILVHGSNMFKPSWGHV